MQVSHEDRLGLIAEVVSNEFLPEDEEWTPGEEEALIALGWEAPQETGLDPSECSPNFFRHWWFDRDNPEAAAGSAIVLLADTLRKMLGVHYPSQLALTLGSNADAERSPGPA